MNVTDQKIESFVARHAKIGFDSNILIGLIEKNSYSDQARSAFVAFHKHSNEIWTVTLTIPEVMIKPIRYGNGDVVRQYESVLFSGLINFADINQSTARSASMLGARYKLKAGDATILACMIENGVTGFITADKDFESITELEVFLVK